MLSCYVMFCHHNTHLAVSGIRMRGRETKLSFASQKRGKTKNIQFAFLQFFLQLLRLCPDLITYLLEEFQARVCLASCKVEAISGNNSSKVSLDPEIMILSPISGAMFTATTSHVPA